VEYRQSIGRVLLLYKRSPILLVGNYFYYEMGKLKIALIMASKSQKLHRNYIENPMGEIYNFII